MKYFPETGRSIVHRKSRRETEILVPLRDKVQNGWSLLPLTPQLPDEPWEEYCRRLAERAYAATLDLTPPTVADIDLALGAITVWEFVK